MTSFPGRPRLLNRYQQPSVACRTPNTERGSTVLSTSDHTSFQYRPLDTRKYQIRLCRILSQRRSSNKTPIQCEIGHYELNNNPNSTNKAGSRGATNSTFQRGPSYIALSYRWGSGKDKVMLLNGEPFQISSNLYHCLSRLGQSHHTADLFWIDQICIDQRNVEEKNHQVQFMQFIYSQAVAVYTWLGKSSKTTKFAFRALDKINSIACSCDGTRDGDRPLQLFLDKSHCDRISGLIEAAPLAGKYALFKLFAREYWSRVWIVQEIFHARDLYLLCGDYRRQVAVEQSYVQIFKLGEQIRQALEKGVQWGLLDNPRQQRWDNFEQAIYHLGHRQPIRNSSSNRGNIPEVLGHPHLVTPDDVPRTDKEWLPITTALSNRTCSNSRDMVFGVQACLRPEERIDVNYGMTTEQVYCAFVRKLVETEDWKHLKYSARPILDLCDRMGIGRMSETKLFQFAKRYGIYDKRHPEKGFPRFP